jgi:DNA-binding Xre family transcriptional regulator
MVRWRLRKYLDEHGVSAYALTKATALAPNTVYALARGDQRRVDLEVLDKVITGLEQLTGRRVELTDLLEREPLEERSNRSWLELAGTFDDPTSPGDIAARHDDYLSEALLEEHREGLEGKR